MAGSGVTVSVERLLEQEVNEIARTGEESYIKPFTLSEELAHLATKVDFHEGWDEDVAEQIDKKVSEEQAIESAEKAKDGGADKAKLPEQWPWEDVRSKLRVALSEVCVLLDVLQTVKEKKYLVLDPINQSAEPPKPTVQMLGKRKCLAKAAEVIRKGAKRMQSEKVEKPGEPVIVEDTQSSYYMELMKLRQYWRVKKTGKLITGDLSYRTAGSQFWHPGLFEVKKSEEESSSSSSECKNPLTVNVSADLEGYARVLVSVKDTSDDPIPVRKAMPETLHASMPPWQVKLKQAQYNLFSKELFAQLSREAFQLKAIETDQVSSNLISCKVLPDVEIDLQYVTSEEEPIAPSSSHFSSVLEKLLHSLLHNQHKRTMDLPIPHPSTTFWGGRQSSKPAVMNLLNRATPPSRRSLLQDFLDAARHSIHCERINMYFDRKCVEVSSPSISCHWNVMCSSTLSSAVVSVVSESSGDRVRSTFSLTVHVNHCHLVFDDGSTVDIPPSSKDLDHVVETEIGKHLLRVGKFLAHKLQWSVIQVTCDLPYSDTGNKSDTCNGILIRAPTGGKSIAIRINKDQKINADLRKVPASQSLVVGQLLDTKWSEVDLISEKVDWSSLHGSSFMEKCQSLMVLANL